MKSRETAHQMQTNWTVSREIGRVNTMTRSLDGVYLKLSRADAHFDSIKEAIKGFIGPQPDLIPGDFDVDVGQYLFRAQRDGHSPTWISPLIGDCLHNLRAALDYVVWELARPHGTNRTQFPIFLDPVPYANRAPKMIKHTPPECSAIFERLQPFYGPNSNMFDPLWRDPATMPLARLYLFDNLDKNRALNPTEELASITLLDLDRFGFAALPGPTGVVRGCFKKDAILAQFDLPEGGPNVELRPSATYHITFDREQPMMLAPVVGTLDEVRVFIRSKVLPALASFFAWSADAPPRLIPQVLGGALVRASTQNTRRLRSLRGPALAEGVYRTCVQPCDPEKPRCRGGI
jgi:hypothetical protein